MSTTAKYGFDTVFDAHGNVIDKPPPRPKTRFTKEDVDTALAEGQAQGQANAEAQAAQAAAAALQTIGTQISSLLDSLNAQTDQLRADSARLAFETARSLATGLIDQAPEDQLTALITECLTPLKGEAQVTIRVPADLADRIDPQITQMAAQAGFPGQIVLEADETLTGTDCRLDWMDGGAEFSLSDRLTDIEKRIADYLQATGSSQLDLFTTMTDQ